MVSLHLFELKPADLAKQSFESDEDYLVSSVHKYEVTQTLSLWFAYTGENLRSFGIMCEEIRKRVIAGIALINLSIFMLSAFG